jgi:hypothetical protein
MSFYLFIVYITLIPGQRVSSQRKEGEFMQLLRDRSENDAAIKEKELQLEERQLDQEDRRISMEEKCLDLEARKMEDLARNTRFITHDGDHSMMHL